MAENQARRWTDKELADRCRRPHLAISIDVLPDDVLLEIFDFYVHEALDEDEIDDRKGIEDWQTLVHVCRRWRAVVFGSPHRLNLELACLSNTPARDVLDVWPPLPLCIRADSPYSMKSMDNIISVLERGDRVRQIILSEVLGYDLENILEVMQEPLPVLTYLRITKSDDETEPVLPLPDSFLGGSAPLLLSLGLNGIPFPELPKLLSSATRLRTLYLENIPHSGYFSPKAIATTLSTLTSLEYLTLRFQSPLSLPDQGTPLTAPSVFPSLRFLRFKGVGEYLEDLVARIEAPQFERLDITLFNQIVFETPQSIQFIRRASRLKALEQARVVFKNRAASLNISSNTSKYRALNVTIPCKELDWQVSSLEQVCTSCLPPLSTLEDLYILGPPSSEPDWKDNLENALWLALLHPFSSVKNLYLSEKFVARIVPALQELVGDRTTEVLPILQNVFLEGPEPSGPVQEGIGKFVAARQATSNPLAVSRWDRK